ncbi:MAG: DUF2264 domain-containing protein [Bacteroidales bacterium]|jgi:hypothetical protein|nr:DUF2264 domain-containing protein [Bacteroidales bacterium]
MKKLLTSSLFLCFATLAIAQSSQTATSQSTADRAYWVDLLYKIAEPVLSNMSKGELKKNMLVEYSPIWDNRDANVVYMEAFGRLMAGIAPWLALPDDDTSEGKQRKQMRQWALKSYANAVDPNSPDYLLWYKKGGPFQPLVDASYIANSFIRAPKTLWEPLDDVTKQRYIAEFKGQRQIVPWNNNWILFRAMNEAFLASIGEDYDPYAIVAAIRQMELWYVGDGWYMDGTEYSQDYYNSYVIHPYLVEITEIMANQKVSVPIKFDLALRRMQRYNRLLERLVSPEATYPAMGRSVTYRLGAFQPLALAAWKYSLPQPLTEGQVRNMLTSVMKRMFSVEGNFNKDGYLQLGFAGHQPELADYYTNTGSLYITSEVFLPLGLPANHSFWTSPAEEWTSQKAWNGKPFQKDYHESVKK